MIYLTFFQVRIVRIATRPIRLGNADNKRLSQLRSHTVSSFESHVLIVEIMLVSSKAVHLDHELILRVSPWHNSKDYRDKYLVVQPTGRFHGAEWEAQELLWRHYYRA